MKWLIGIKKYHHFIVDSSNPGVDSSNPGVVTIKVHPDSEAERFHLLKQPWNPDSSELPNIVVPKSLSIDAQWYLLDQIRQFCSERAKDITFPLPSVPRLGNRSGTPIPSHSQELASATSLPSEEPPRKKM